MLPVELQVTNFMPLTERQMLCTEKPCSLGGQVIWIPCIKSMTPPPRSHAQRPHLQPIQPLILIYWPDMKIYIRLALQHDSELTDVDPCTLNYMSLSESFIRVARSDRRFHCSYDDCTRKFGRQEHLKRHEIIHTGEKPFLCPVPQCGMAFNRPDNLKSHKERHKKNKKGSRVLYVKDLK
ncbi:hypothetical protein BDZ91DRAFT_319925 [Kalaharituber pfeilii]|nr:hypothetical protein BDZ91DRAFT_319925 [Kalaharituber pfeilii]